MKKIISMLMLVLCLCTMNVGCTKSTEEVNSSKVETPKLKSIEELSKDLERNIRKNIDDTMEVEIDCEGNEITIWFKDTTKDMDNYDFDINFAKPILNNKDTRNKLIKLFNGYMEKYNEKGFNDIKLDISFLDKKGALMFSIISDKKIDDQFLIDRFTFDDSDKYSQSNNNAYYDEGIVRDYNDYGDGLTNALRTEITYMETYYGKPLIKIDHKNKVVRLTYNQAPSELNILIDQNRWAYDEFELSYEMLEESVNEVVGYDYTTTVTVECDGRFVYSR